MGKSRTLLITKDQVHENNIIENKLYFSDNGYSIFPFEIGWHETEIINETFRSFALIEEITEKRKAFSKNVNAILDTIIDFKIKSFLLIHDDGELYALIVKNEQIFQERDWDSIEDILNYFTNYEDNLDFNKY